MAKGIKNADAVARKLGSALTKATNHKLDVSGEEKCKREEMVERRKTKTMATKRCRDRGGISLSSGKEENHKTDTRDDTNPDQAKDKYPLQLWVAMGGKL